MPDPGAKPGSPTFLADSSLFEPPGKPSIVHNFQLNIGITSMFVKVLYSQATFPHIPIFQNQEGQQLATLGSSRIFLL